MSITPHLKMCQLTVGSKHIPKCIQQGLPWHASGSSDCEENVRVLPNLKIHCRAHNSQPFSTCWAR